MGELDGKVAIVTGAGRMRGIGRASAVSLAKLGADVVVTGTGRDPSRYPEDEKAAGWKDIESAAAQVRELGRRSLPLVVDVSDADHVNEMVDTTVKELGRVDILINNAAYARGPDRVPILELDDGVFQRVIDIKIGGTYLCSKAVVGQLVKQGEGGKIVNIASVAGKVGAEETLAYNAGNFAQVGMTQSMAAELGKYDINVNCVCPGWVDTSRIDGLKVGDWVEQTEKSTPIGRLGTDDEVGDFIAYLCTRAASWIHGQSINMDGGAFMAH